MSMYVIQLSFKNSLLGKLQNNCLHYISFMLVEDVLLST